MFCIYEILLILRIFFTANLKLGIAGTRLVIAGCETEVDEDEILEELMEPLVLLGKDDDYVPPQYACKCDSVSENFHLGF